MSSYSQQRSAVKLRVKEAFRAECDSFSDLIRGPGLGGQLWSIEHDQLLLSDQWGPHQDALGTRCLYFSTHHTFLTRLSLFLAASLYPGTSSSPFRTLRKHSRWPLLCPSTLPSITLSTPSISLQFLRLWPSLHTEPSAPPSPLPCASLWSHFLGSPQHQAGPPEAPLDPSLPLTSLTQCLQCSLVCLPTHLPSQWLPKPGSRHCNILYCIPLREAAGPTLMPPRHTSLFPELILRDTCYPTLPTGEALPGHLKKTLTPEYAFSLLSVYKLITK